MRFTQAVVRKTVAMPRSSGSPRLCGSKTLSTGATGGELSFPARLLAPVACKADKIRDHLRDKGVEILERLGRPSGLDRATGTRGLGREGRGDARQRGL